MSVLRKILSGKSAAQVAAPSDTLVLIDGPSVYGSRSKHLSPKEKLGILNRLVAIQQAEGWELVAYFEGEELRKVESGAMFDDVVRCQFAPHAEAFLDQMEGEIKVGKKRKHVVLVTSDPDLIARAQPLGCAQLTANTFKKAFDRGGRSSRGGDRRGDRRGGGGRDGRRRRRRRRDDDGGGDGGGGRDSRDDINRLIDPI